LSVRAADAGTRWLPARPTGCTIACVHEGLDFVLRFTLLVSAGVIVLVAITVAIFLYVRRRSRSAN
jgi:hypothetical protein